MVDQHHPGVGQDGGGLGGSLGPGGAGSRLFMQSSRSAGGRSGAGGRRLIPGLLGAGRLDLETAAHNHDASRHQAQHGQAGQQVEDTPGAALAAATAHLGGVHGRTAAGAMAALGAARIIGHGLDKDPFFL